jgi:eukaryotic-like serine/threonine-protein kinase
LVNRANPGAQSPTELPELTPGTVVEGRYRVIRLIGVGGTGIVYEVEHLLTSQRLALKTLLDRAQAPRLEQEGRALARLRSPHVVKVVDLGSGSAEVGPFLVMTLLEGRNLRDVLESRQKLSLAFVSNVAVQVCEALEEAHRAGLVHRDLKPDNIHLADAAPAKAQGPNELAHATLFDFGVVKVAATEPTNQLTRTGSTVGTPYYMSLEQLRGSGTVDAISDVYAFCVVLYECFAGTRPFEAGTLGDLIYAICSTTPAHLSTLRPDLPKDVVDVVMRGLSRVKDERPRSMRDLALALEPYADKGFTVWLRMPEQAASGGAPAIKPAPPVVPPPAPPPPAPLPSTVPTQDPVAEPVASPAPASVRPTTTTSTATNPAPRLPRPTERLQRPPLKKPEAPGASTGPLGLVPPTPAGAPRPPQTVPPVAAGTPLPLNAAGIPSLADPMTQSVTSSLDVSTPVDDEVAGRRDRETPTEMFVREVHGDVLPEAGQPTMAMPATTGPPGQFGAGFSVVDPASIDNADKTAVLDLDAVHSQAAQARGAAHPPAPSFGAPPPSFGRQPGMTTSSPPNGIPTAPLYPVGMGGMPPEARPSFPGRAGSMPDLGSSSPNWAAPSWQTKLDNALSGLGKRGNELGIKTLARFRSASQEQQIVIVVVVTATVAVLLVGFAYLVAF